MIPQASLFILLLISATSSQTCSNTGFDSGSEVVAPLGVITFDDLGLKSAWASVSNEILRITPAASMEVTFFGVDDGSNTVLIINNWQTDLGSNSYWYKADFYVSFQSNLNTALITFATPIRQFSLKLSHNQNCGGGTPQFTLKDAAGNNITCMQFNVAPPSDTANAIHIFRYRSTSANVKTLKFSGCQFVFDDISYKVDPCNPSPCNTATENCIDLGMDTTCCPKNSTWNGVKCITGNPCIDDSPCDPLATCNALRTGGYTCTCPLKYIGDGTPGNCTPLQPAPSNVTYNIVPILECIDQNNVAQFGYTSNETSVLLIDDLLRNTLEPVNVAPVEVFLPGRTRGYPLNPGQVLLNVTSTQYVWHLQNISLDFTKQSALTCPIQISIVFSFAISGAVNAAQFAEQTRQAFIFATSVNPNRVILVNVTESSSVNKRSIAQLDTTELEVELSVTPPPDNTQPSSADVIREFVSNQQDDMQYNLNQANPNKTISASVVTTKAAPDIPSAPNAASPTIGQPSSLPPSSSEPTRNEPQGSPMRVIASSAQAVQWVGHVLLLISIPSLL